MMKATLKLLIAALLIPASAMAQEHKQGMQKEEAGETQCMMKNKMMNDKMMGSGMMQRSMQPGMMRGGMMSGGMMGMGSGMPALRSVMRRVLMFQPKAVLDRAESLDLTKSQETRLKKLLESAESRTATDDSMIRADMRALAREFDNAAASSKTVKKLVDRIHSRMSELQAAAITDALAVRSELSPSQRERVVAGHHGTMGGVQGMDGTERGSHEQHHK